jgi:predicted Fe-Mo cluster-binding NifX family protein
MKVAIPIFNNRVSPRFEYAPALLLASVEDNRVVEKKELSLAKHDFFRRCALIKELGVDTLICGGINAFTIRLLDWRNVQVVSPASGDVEDVLQHFLRGELDITFAPLCPARVRGRYHGGKERRFGPRQRRRRS